VVGHVVHRADVERRAAGATCASNQRGRCAKTVKWSVAGTSERDNSQQNNPGEQMENKNDTQHYAQRYNNNTTTIQQQQLTCVAHGVLLVRKIRVVLLEGQSRHASGVDLRLQHVAGVAVEGAALWVGVRRVK